ncbi:membrane protein, partial [Mycobacterium terramassiliense]
VTEEVRDMDSAAPEPEPEPEAEEDAADVDPEAEEDAADDAAEPEADEEDSAELSEPRRRGLPPGLRKIVAPVLIVLLLISGGVATWLYFKQYRPDQQTDTDVARTVARAGSDGTVALLSYSYDSLDKDFAAARKHLTGDFLSYYDQFSQQTVAPMAKQKSMKTTAKVTGAAVSELHPDSAVVLVFVDQVTSTKDSPQPSVAVSSVLVRMSRVGGNWLITKFTPI